MSAFANLDTGFPMFRPGMSTEQKLQAMEDYLVQVLEPVKAPKPDAPKPMPIALGVLSVLAALGIVVYCVWFARKNGRERRDLAW